MASTYPYPFDNTGTLPSNKLTDEQHVLSFYSNPTKTIIPVFAPFYRNSLRILHVPTGEYLTEGMDYYLGHIFESAQMDQRYSVYGSISFTELEMQGNVVIEYQTLGGPYTIPFEEILIYLNAPFERPQSRVWKEVMKYPRDIVPMDPINSLPEAILRDPVTRALNQIQLKLNEYYEDTQDKLDAIFLELERVETEIVDWGFPTHDHENGLAHSLTPAQTGAVALRGTAKNALKAYNMSLAELVSYIEQININQDKLDEYLPLAGGTVRGRIKFANDKAFIVNGNSTTTVDLRSGNVKISSKGDVTLQANAKKNDDVTTLLRSGLNRLAIGSEDGTVDNNALAYNGYMVLHAGNIGEFIPKLEESKLPIATEVSEYVMLRGTGRGESAVALDGVVTFPKATVTKEGVVILSHHPATDNDLIVPSSKAIYTLKVAIDGKLDETTTINGKPLTSDITIDAADLGLGRVNNTSPENKPASTAYKAAAAAKALDGHTHPISDFDGFINAAVDIYGFFRLSSDITSSSTDHAATPHAAFQLDNVIKTIESEAGKYIPANALDVTAYGGTSGLPISVSGSFVNNGYPKDTLGKTAMIVQGGYLKFLRNGGSFGEDFAPYYSYATLDGEAMGDIVNTTVKYEPSFVAPGRMVRSVLTANQDYMLVVTNTKGDDDYQLMLIKMNGNIDATLHNGQAIDMPYNVDLPEYSLFVINGYVYIMHFTDFRQQTYKMYRLAESKVGSASLVALDPVLTSTDHIGGRAALKHDQRLYNYNMRDRSEYNFIAVQPGHSYNLFRVVYHTGTVRTINVINGKVYMYFGYEGNHSISGVYGIYFHTACTWEFNPTTDEFTLLGGWPDSIDNIPEYLGGTEIDLHGQLDRRVERLEISKAIQTHHMRGQLHNIGKYELCYGGREDTKPVVGLDSFNADPMTRINALTRATTINIGHYMLTAAGGAIKRNPLGVAIGYLPLNGTGAETLCMMGTSEDNTRYWAMPYNEDESKAALEAGTYPYNKSWSIDHPTLRDATTGAVNQQTGAKLHAFKENSATCAGHPYTIIDNIDDYPVTGSAIDPARSGYFKKRQLLILEDIDGVSAKWNAVGTVSHGGWIDDTNFRSEVFQYRAKVSRSGTTYTVTEIELLPGAPAPEIIRTFYRAGLYSMYDWLSNISITGTTELAIVMPFERFDSTHGNLLFVCPYDANGIGAVVSRARHHCHTGAANSPVIFGTYPTRMVTDSSYTALVAYVYNRSDMSEKYRERPTVMVAISDNWSVFFTVEQKYYASQEEYVIPTETFDLKVLFPTNHANNVFYLYANVINDVGVYEISETLEDDYGARSYIGYVSTDNLGIHELDVRPLLRLGRVQELIDHANNPIAHTGSELGGDAIGLGKVQNLELEHEFNPEDVPNPIKYISEAAVLDFKIEMQHRRTLVKGSRSFANGTQAEEFIMNQNQDYAKAHLGLSSCSIVRYDSHIKDFRYSPVVFDGIRWISEISTNRTAAVTAPTAQGVWIRDGKET